MGTLYTYISMLGNTYISDDEKTNIQFILNKLLNYIHV